MVTIDKDSLLHWLQRGEKRVKKERSIRRTTMGRAHHIVRVRYEREVKVEEVQLELYGHR